MHVKSIAQFFKFYLSLLNISANLNITISVKDNVESMHGKSSEFMNVEISEWFNLVLGYDLSGI